MPKLRKDLQTNANRIDWRIATIGKPAVLQIDPRHTYFVVAVGRPKLPPLRLEGHQGVNNLMTISAGSVLDSRYVRVFPDHWLSQFVENPAACNKWGIIFRKGVPYVRTYDVIDGLAFAQRRVKHILAGYETELQSLRQTENDLRSTLAGPTFLMSERKVRSLKAALLWVENRKEEIRRILSQKAVQTVNLHFAFEKTQSRLTQMAATVERWSEAIRQQPDQIRIGSVQQMTNPILAELPFFGSKEIRPLVGKVRIAFGVFAKRTDLDSVATRKLAASLDQVVTVLLAAVETLEREADAISDSEKAAAAKLLSGRLH